MVKVLQLGVQIGQCRLPQCITRNFRSFLLTVSLSPELSAATTFKEPASETLEFGTRLFIRMDKLPPNTIPMCLIVLTGMQQNGSKSEIAKGSYLGKAEGLRWLSLRLEEEGEQKVELEVQFYSKMVQARQGKSINNKSTSFKSSVSQKQSSCELKQRQSKKSLGNIHSLQELERYDSKDSIEIAQTSAKVSKITAQNNKFKEQLQTSAGTSKPQNKHEQSISKEEDQSLYLSYQIRINQLEQTITQVNQQLHQCNLHLTDTMAACNQEKLKNQQLRRENQELLELLNLEEERAKIAHQHGQRLAKIIEQICKGDGPFQLIQEKDQIIMLNQELETENNSQKTIIQELKIEITGLKDKISNMESKSQQTIHNQHSNALKKLPQLASKQLQRVKSDKKLTQKKGTNWNKKQEDITKQTNHSKEGSAKPKEADRKKTKKDIEVKATEKIKTRVNTKQQAPALKIPKAKPSKGMKNEQKHAVQPQKKSIIQTSFGGKSLEIESLQHSTNLMLNSRTIQPETPIKEEKH